MTEHSEESHALFQIAFGERAQEDSVFDMAVDLADDGIELGWKKKPDPYAGMGFYAIGKVHHRRIRDKVKARATRDALRAAAATVAPA